MLTSAHFQEVRVPDVRASVRERTSAVVFPVVTRKVWRFGYVCRPSKVF